MTSTDIAKEFNVSYQTIINYLRKNSVSIRKSSKKLFDDHLLSAAYLSGLSLKQVAEKYNTSEATVCNALKKNNIKARPLPKGKDHPLWRGGKYHDADDYVVISNDGKRFHRELMKTLIGRDVYHWECVHHIDGDKSNNNVNNLVIMPIREHTRFHNFLYFRGLEISENNLKLYARQESNFYFRFTKTDFDKHSGIDKLPKVSKKRAKCQEKGCDNERYGNKKICNKHYQRVRAKERGYWISGGGRKAQFRLGASDEGKKLSGKKHGLFGRKLSKEIKEKMSASKIGKNISDDTRNKRSKV
jgi:predicted DNA-binding protein YlxM (UPF0122 family)